MNIQANKLLWKNKLRLMKGMLRHTWQGALGLVIAAVVVLYQVFFAVDSEGLDAAVSPQGTWYVLLAVAAFNFFRVFLSQTPVFRIDGASLLLTYNTVYFKKLLRRRMWLSAVSAVFLSIIISWVLSGFQFNDDFALTSALLILYICGCSFLSWIFYHGKRKLRAAVVLLFAVCTAMLLSKSWLSAGVLAAFLCGLAVYGHSFLKLDLAKYNRRLQYLDASLAAVSQNDFAKMSQMAEENRPSAVNGPKFQHFRPSKKTALWIKSLLELLRMQKQLVLMFALLFLGGWIISRTELLGWLPFLDDPAITNVLAVFCTAAGLASLYQLLVKQAETVSEKRSLGLSLPMTTARIFISYGLSAVLLNSILAAVISVLYQILLPRLLLLWVVENGAYWIMSYAALRNLKHKREAAMAANLLLFAGIYFCLLF